MATFVVNTKVITCTCRNKFQDGAYGLQKRIATLDERMAYRCTSCGKVV